MDIVFLNLEGFQIKYNIGVRKFIIAGAFTQIVWKSTKLIGMAVHPGKEQLIVVATYSPRGNTWDDYLTNVVTMKDRMEDLLSSWGSKKQRTC